jgi:hypothetical protein
VDLFELVILAAWFVQNVLVYLAVGAILAVLLRLYHNRAR